MPQPLPSPHTRRVPFVGSPRALPAWLSRSRDPTAVQPVATNPPRVARWLSRLLLALILLVPFLLVGEERLGRHPA